MNINLSFFSELVLLSMFIVGGLSYYLGKRKTTKPKVVTLIDVLLCIAPPLNIVCLIVLTLKNDNSPDKPVESQV